MKILSSILLVLLLFTGCVNTSPENANIEPKQTLINEANSGNTKAILKLVEHYEFPATKEGLYYFNKWYDNLYNEKDLEQLVKVADVYYEYNSMFINGKSKASKLYEFAAIKGNIKANFRMIDKYVYEYRYDKAKEIEDKIIDTLSYEQLLELYMVYDKRYSHTDKARISQYFKDKYSSVPFEIKFQELRTMLYNHSNQTNQSIDEIVSTSQNADELLKVAKLLSSQYMYDKSIEIYKKCSKLDPNNGDTYFNLAKAYEYINYKENEELIIKYLEKAAKLNNKEALAKLLNRYSSDKKHADSFLRLKSEVEKTKEGKFLLAEHYRGTRFNDKANAIYSQLAEEGDERAILSLALLTQSSYFYDPEEYMLIKKWQDYILNQQDTQLKRDFIHEITTNSTYKWYYNDLVEQFSQESNIVNNENILALRELAVANRYQNITLAISYYQQAADAGDVKSIINLADTYLYKQDAEYEKGEKLLREVFQKGDIQAGYKLANLYKNPPYVFKDKKDMKKAIEIYEKLAEKDEIVAMSRLVEYLMYADCEDYGYSDNIDTSLIDTEKGFYYASKLLEARGSGTDYAWIGWAYANGKGVKKDLNKAEEYYLEAAKKGYIKAYYNLAWFYYKNNNTKTLDIIELNYEKARKYIEEGVKYGDSDCINLLGIFYQNGYSVEQDMQKAVQLFESIAPYNRYAAYNLASYYKDQKDYENAFKYYQYSHDGQYASATIELGVLYELGLGVEQDMQKAFDLFLYAYEHKYDKSQKDYAAYKLGLFYQYGKGEIKKDINKAKEWYNLSNCEDAKAALKTLK